MTPPTPTPLLPELAAMAGHVIWRAAARVHATMAETLSAGVDIKGYAVLLALGDGPPRTQQALADAIDVSRTTMTSIAARLVDRGLVKRVRNPDDRRSYALTRTAAGGDAVEAWRAPLADLEVRLTSGMDPEEAAELRRLLLAAMGPVLPADAPEPLRSTLGFLITRMHFRLHREFLAALAPYGIEPPHFGVLAALQVTGPVSQAEAARIMGVSGARVVALVDELEERGLVERRRAPGDRRTQLLHLLPTADDVVARTEGPAAEVADDRLAALSVAERKRLVTLLVRFVEAG